MQSLTPWNKAWLCAACLAFGLSWTVAASPKKRIVIKKQNVDPQAETVELFDGINKGLLDAHLVPHNADGGNVFIENKTDRPLTVKLPKAVAAVQVLKQGFGGGGGGAGRGGRGGGAGGGAGGGGAAQSMGGGMTGGGMGGGMGGGEGGAPRRASAGSSAGGGASGGGYDDDYGQSAPSGGGRGGSSAPDLDDDIPF